MPRKGQKLTPEQRKKISESKKHLTPQQRENIAAAQRGKKASVSTRNKMSAAHLGHSVSDKAREAIGNAHRGKVVSDASKELNRQKHIGKIVSDDTKEKMRLSHLGEKNAFYGQEHSSESLELMKGPKTDLHKQHLSEAKIGIVPSNIEILKVSRNGLHNSEEMIAKQRETLAMPEVKDKMKESHVREKNANWKNGRTPLNEVIRGSSKYYEWRNAIFKRDNYTDVLTGEKGSGDLNAHHLVPYFEIMDRNNITTYEEAMACEELWDISNGITMLEKNHIKLHTKTGEPE